MCPSKGILLCSGFIGKPFLIPATLSSFGFSEVLNIQLKIEPLVLGTQVLPSILIQFFCVRIFICITSSKTRRCRKRICQTPDLTDFNQAWNLNGEMQLDAYTRWWQLKYFLTPRRLGKMNPIWLSHIFQMGWFNHQPEYFQLSHISPEKMVPCFGVGVIFHDFSAPCFHGFLQRWPRPTPRLSFNFGSHPFCYDLAELPTLKVGSLGDRVERLLRWKNKRDSQRWRSWGDAIFIYIYIYVFIFIFDITWYDISQDRLFVSFMSYLGYAWKFPQYWSTLSHWQPFICVRFKACFMFN